MARSFLHSSMMCTRCAIPKGPGTSMICSLRSCLPLQASGCTLARHKVWNRVGEAPDRLEELGPLMRRLAGLKILGTPVGTPEFHAESTRERLEVETQLWRAIPWVLDFQCAWQLLVQCAGPRCPPSFALEQSSMDAQGRERHGGSHDNSVGRDVRRRSTEAGCRAVGHVADEDGRTRLAFRSPNPTSCILGFVG